MLKDRQTTARTMPRLERTETEIKSFCTEHTPHSSLRRPGVQGELVL